MLSFKEFIVEETGTFVGVEFSPETKDEIMRFIEMNGIQNPVTPDKLHTTLIFSRSPLIDFKTRDDIYPMETTATEFAVWKSGDGESDVLVVKLLAGDLISRHKQIMMDHPEATYDFPSYIPHVTLSYNIDSDIDFEKMDLTKFPKVVMVKEYMDKLDLGFGK